MFEVHGWVLVLGLYLGVGLLLAYLSLNRGKRLDPEGYREHHFDHLPIFLFGVGMLMVGWPIFLGIVVVRNKR